MGYVTTSATGYGKEELARLWYSAGGVEPPEAPFKENGSERKRLTKRQILGILG